MKIVSHRFPRQLARPAEPPAPVSICDRRRALHYASKIDPSDLYSVTGFGRGTQTRLGGLVDEVMERLESSRANRDRAAREVNTLCSLEPRPLSRWSRTLSQTRFGSWLDLESRLVARQERLDDRLDGIIARLIDASTRLIGEIDALDGLARRNRERLETMEAQLAGLRLRIDGLARRITPLVAQRAAGEHDPDGTLDSLNEQLRRLEARLDSLEGSRAIGLRQAQRIHEFRGELEEWLAQAQYGLYGIIPIWKERIQDAILGLRIEQADRSRRDGLRHLNEVHRLPRSAATEPARRPSDSRHDPAETASETAGILPSSALDAELDGEPLNGTERPGHLLGNGVAMLRALRDGSMPALFRGTDFWWH